MLLSTESAWKKFGCKDPYFGVLTEPKFHQDAITDKSKEIFFDSGERQIEKTFENIENFCGRKTFLRTLDFGCGVGRLTIPLTKSSGTVVGVDISPAMLEEAADNCKKRLIDNVEFLETQEWLDKSNDKYDLIHTHIVLQHIPTAKGLSLIHQFIKRLSPDGVCAIHVTYEKDSRWRHIKHGLRKWTPFLQAFVNVLRKRSIDTPFMQMNPYNINKISKILQNSGIDGYQSYFTNHGGNFGMTIYFQKPA